MSFIQCPLSEVPLYNKRTLLRGTYIVLYTHTIKSSINIEKAKGVHTSVLRGDYYEGFHCIQVKVLLYDCQLWGTLLTRSSGIDWILQSSRSVSASQ